SFPTRRSSDLFGCLAFGLLTGRELVWGPSEVAIITAHLSHDGDFEGLRWLASHPMLAPVADILAGALRQDPRARTPMRELRAQLAEIAPGLANMRWPLAVHLAA